jgi:hypothetical protein
MACFKEINHKEAAQSERTGGTFCPRFFSVPSALFHKFPNFYFHLRPAVKTLSRSFRPPTFNNTTKMARLAAFFAIMALAAGSALAGE